jgi:glycosyltransferase involved in cell wall biosynthesis
LATVNVLAARGHQVTVLTVGTDTFDVAVGGDHSLLAAVDPRVRLVRVDVPPTFHDPVVNRWPAGRVADPAWNRAAAAIWEQRFPDATYGIWLAPLLAAARQLHGAAPFDLVIATGNPYVDFGVALLLGQESGVPVVLDDRDSWYFNVYTGQPAHNAAGVRPWLELALDVAQEFWLVNPPLAAIHEAQFPGAEGKVQVVENGWDPRFSPVDPAAPRTWGGRGPAGNGVDFSFVGTISPALPAQLMVDAWAKARAAEPSLAAGTLRFVGHYGYSGAVSDRQRALAAAAQRHGVEFTGRKAKSELMQVYANTDVLLFAKEGGHLVTSGKVYEYVATGLPIVALIKPGHDARRVLAGYPLLFEAAEVSVPAVAEAMVRAARHQPTEAELAAARQYGAGYSREAIFTRAFDRLDRTLGWA